MRKLKNLEEVNAAALPAKVLVLLSKYANALRKHNGLILKLSSLNVFRNVHTMYDPVQAQQSQLAAYASSW